MVTVADVLPADLDDLAGLYEELVGKPTNLAKLAENLVWMQSNPDYIVLAAKDTTSCLFPGVTAKMPMIAWVITWIWFKASRNICRLMNPIERNKFCV